MIFKTALVGTGDGEVYKIDVTEHEGALWLVPEWVEVINPIGQEPARAIRLTGLAYQSSAQPGIDFVVIGSIPKPILFGPTPPEGAGEFVVVDRPVDNRIARPN